MNTILAIVTLVSLGFAVALLIVSRRVTREERRRSDARVEALRAAAAGNADGVDPVVVSGHGLFDSAADPDPSRWRHALLVAVCAALTLVVVIGALSWSQDGRPGAAGGGAASLELLALRHQRSPDGLSITGLVRNPVAGDQVADVSVVVLGFDRSGALVTTVAGPIDFRTLAPGEESQFTVSLGEAGAIGRYRVSFRARDMVVPHVDRRGDPIAVARQ